MKKLLRVFAVWLVIQACIVNANALTIILTNGNGTPSTNLFGGGNLTDIANYNREIYELIFRDQRTNCITYEWAPTYTTYGGLGALETMLGQGGIPCRETNSLIQVDNSGSYPWYANPAPWSYVTNGTYQEQYDTNFGCGPMNDTRIWTCSGSRTWVSLSRTFGHEMGHALGLDVGCSAFTALTNNGYMLVTNGPYAGAKICFQGSTAHPVFPTVTADPLMSGTITDGEGIPDVYSIVAIATAGGFTNVNWNLTPQLNLAGVDAKGNMKMWWIQPVPPPPGTHYVVEKSPNATGGPWTTVTSKITVTSWHFNITVPASDRCSFFRLAAR